VAASDWNFRHPVELQDYSWDCAAASLAWALQAAGLPYTEQQVIDGLGPTRISPALGLLDASGAGLVEWLGEIGVASENTASATWDDVVAAAGYQPMVIGGRSWYHWSGVRMAGPCAVGTDVGLLALANPAPGWMGIQQTLDPQQFANLGVFSAVWFNSWPR
jgi:hypothetical protein